MATEATNYQHPALFSSEVSVLAEFYTVGQKSSFVETVASIYAEKGRELCIAGRSLYEDRADNTPEQKEGINLFRLGAAAHAFGILLPLVTRAPFDEAIDIDYLSVALRKAGFNINFLPTNLSQDLVKISPEVLDKDPLCASFFLPDELGNYSMLPNGLQQLLIHLNIWDEITRIIIPEYINRFTQLAWEYRIQNFPKRLAGLGREMDAINLSDNILEDNDIS